jgi:hypothetical protein
MSTEIPPHMQANEIAEICKHLRNWHKMLEWGSGGSSLVFAPLVEQFVSIEHDAKWADKIRRCGVDVVLVPVAWQGAQPGDLSKFADYIRRPTTFGIKFDRILIDGRCRVACGIAALSCLAPDGLVFIHDWSRSRYHQLKQHYDVITTIPPNGMQLDGGLAVLRRKTRRLT